MVVYVLVINDCSGWYNNGMKMRLGTLRLLILLVFFCLFIFLASMAFSVGAKDFLVYFFDVGQGDATLIRLPKGIDILIDAGPSDGAILPPLAKSLGSFDRQIDLLILTHFDKDHAGGAEEILNRYQVSYVLAPKYLGAPLGEAVYNLAKQKNIPTKELRRGDRIVFSDSINLLVLAPDESLVLAKDRNSGGVVFVFEYFDKHLIFPGDIPESVENKIAVTDGENLSADILHVAHHGSNTSTGVLFLSAVSPKQAIISAGRGNPYRHPHPAVLERLESFKVETFRTDLWGTIAYRFKNNSFEFEKVGK